MARMGAGIFSRVIVTDGAGHYLQLPSLTTAQRNALGVAAPRLIYNSTTSRIQSCEGGAWADIGSVYGGATFIPLAQKAAASGVASLDGSSKVVQDPATAYTPLSQKAAASGVASLDAAGRVVQASAASAPVMRLPRIGAYFSPSYYPNDWTGQTFTPGINQLVAVPYPMVKQLTWDRIGAFISTGQVSGKCRVGLYKDTGARYPGALVVDSGELAATGTAWVEGTINTATLPTDDDWIAFLCNDAGIVLRGPAAAAILQAPYGETAVGSPLLGIIVAQAYGALPDPFTAGGTPENKPYALGLRLKTIDS